MGRQETPRPEGGARAKDNGGRELRHRRFSFATDFQSKVVGAVPAPSPQPGSLCGAADLLKMAVPLP